jgi:hypothetical protein
MGNCGASRHAVESWADDGEWGEEEEVDEASSEEGDHQQQRGHGTKEEHHVTEEVTIRITRRQLQELMEKKKQGHGGLGIGRGRRSTEQLLVDIMNSGEVHHHHHAEAHWHWMPALQSIPEAAVVS